MDPRLTELHCIMPMVNIPSVMEHGILSYERVAKLDHRSVAMPEVQERRDRKQVPRGLRLHQYANLYFHARNPMLYKRQDQFADLCILRVSLEVLDLPGVVLTDQNASSDYSRFLPTQDARKLDFDVIYALDWNHPDPIEKMRHKSKKCAEVLVPHQVQPRLLCGAYVLDTPASVKLVNHGFNLPITVNRHIFFR